MCFTSGKIPIPMFNSTPFITRVHTQNLANRIRIGPYFILFCAKACQKCGDVYFAIRMFQVLSHYAFPLKQQPYTSAGDQKRHCASKMVFGNYIIHYEKTFNSNSKRQSCLNGTRLPTRDVVKSKSVSQPFNSLIL